MSTVYARDERARLAPKTARSVFRSGVVEPTSDWSHGHAQANMISVPEDWAYDVLLFSQRNRKPCPVLDVTDAGATSTILAAGSDLRTDLARYRVWERGELVDEPTEVLAHWREDLVTFLIGCSFTFEFALTTAGVPLRHVEQGRNVSMYVTATSVSGLMPEVHGAPVHVRTPAKLGIRDLAKPDFGDAVMPHKGDVPVFWACGVTRQPALMASKPPFAITHAPGHMFVTDEPDSYYRVGAAE